MLHASFVCQPCIIIPPYNNNITRTGTVWLSHSYLEISPSHYYPHIIMPSYSCLFPSIYFHLISYFAPLSECGSFIYCVIDSKKIRYISHHYQLVCTVLGSKAIHRLDRAEIDEVLLFNIQLK